jgi:hypothetical protein
MTKSILVFGLVGGCANQPATPLAQLPPSQIEIVADGQINIELHITTSECPLLRENTVAIFDGIPMNVSRGGYAFDHSGCYPIAFWVSQPGDVRVYERSATGSRLVVEDGSATWSIDTGRLLANDFQIDTTAARIVWPDVTQITTAGLVPNVPISIDGNTIHYPTGTNVERVDAYAHPTVSRCDGPVTCTVDLSGARNFDGITP